jgi:hypothetical protein
MTLNLTRRSVKGSPLTAVDHDTNLDKIETGVLARPTTAAQTSAIAAAVDAHVAAADPHSQYLTAAEGDAAYATAAQGTLASTAIQPGNAALSDAREWIAATIEQAEAEAGTATTRRAFTAQRVFQAIAAWWAASSAKTKLDGIETGAQVNVATNLTYDAPTREVRSSTGSDATLPLVSTSNAGLQAATSFAALDYASTVDLDMAALDGQARTITLTDALTFTASNRAAGRRVVLRLLPGGAERTLTFPADWVFVSAKPVNVAANKSAVLSLTFFGTTDADCIAAYAVQP